MNKIESILTVLFFSASQVIYATEYHTDICIDSLSSDTLNPDNTFNQEDYRVKEFSQDDLKSLESIINEYEKQNLIKKEITTFEDKLLKKEMSFDWFSTLPVIRGAVLTASTDRFKNRDALFEYKKSEKWEYIPTVVPLATTWALKAVGVESRSKTKRMFTANSIGLGMGFGMTFLLKNTANELRPNGHDKHSLSSGHSSLAFFSAAVLDREYGHYSPWVSIGGYSLAVATQLRRIHRHHHYINDVVTGAGVGIVCANLGYFITDRIFGEKEINNPRLTMGDISTFYKFLNRPSSVSLYSGLETGYNRISSKCVEPTDYIDDISFRTTTGFSTGIEFDFFLNQNWAIEALARASQFKVQAFAADSEPSIYGNNLYQYHFDIGTKYSVPITPERRFAFRAFAGERLSPEVKFEDYNGNEVATIKDMNNFEFGGGIAFDMLSTSKYLTGFSCDYIHACSSLLKNRWNISSYWKILF